MRALRLVGIVLGGLVVLIAVLLLAVKLFVNPNDYKSRIAQAVRSSTGRELTLSGPIKLSVFPWIALEVGPASLGNPPGFSAEPFAVVQHVAFRVKLLPLLHKELEIGHIEIDGLDLRLRKNAAGKGNWQDFGGSNSAAPQPVPAGDSLADRSVVPAGDSLADRSVGGPMGQALPDLAGVDIKDSHLSYQDENADHVTLEIGHVTSGTPIPVKLQLDLTTGRGAQPIGIDARMDVTLYPAGKRYRVASLDVDGTLKPVPTAAAVAWKFSVPQLDVDLTAQTFSIPAFVAELAAAHLTGDVQGNKIIDAPSLTGTFKLDPVALRDLLGKLGGTPPDTRDPKAFTQLAARGNFSYGGNAVAANNLEIQLDDSQLKGKVAVTNLDSKATDFNLAIDRIDLDRYRSPETAGPSVLRPSGQRGNPQRGRAPPPSPAAQPAEKGAESSPDALMTLDMNGSLAIGRATVASLNATQVLVTVAAKDGVLHIAPAKATLYGGEYSGDITLDDRAARRTDGPAVPSLKIDQSMTGVDIAGLLKDFSGSQRISGRGNVTTHLTAQGLGGEALLRTLNGQLTAEVGNGAVEGVDLWFEINRAMALLQKQSMPGGKDSGQTRFDAFKASANITNGVASTKDLNIASQALRVTGQGTTNLVTNAIDYQVKATLLKEAPGAATATGKTLADIPLNITGTIASPKVRPDLEAMAKARVQQELEKHKGELQQKLQDKLKGLFK